MMKLALLIFTSVLATTGIMYLRKVKFPPLDRITFDSVITFITQPALWLGVTFSGIVFLFYLWILSKYETSSVVPALLGINLAVISIFSVLFFGEPLTLTKFIAYACILGGVILLT